MEVTSVLGLANPELGELPIEYAIIVRFYANLTGYYPLLLACTVTLRAACVLVS